MKATDANDTQTALLDEKNDSQSPPGSFVLASPYITFADILEGDEDEVTNTLQNPEMTEAMEALGALPDILRPAQPPASAKEQVMSHLHEPIVAIFVPQPGEKMKDGR